MYSQHFGLTQDPFSIAPDPRYLFMSERHREALAHLLYGITGSDKARASGGFVLLTGDIGTGKTTICRCFLEQIPPGCHVAYIFNPKLTVTELLQSICQEFHVAPAQSGTRLPSVKEYIDALNAFLLQSHAAGQSSVLIIDEAQNLSAEVLEQLRLLTNLETNERKLLQIVLIGQPELRAMLARPELEQLAQRVIARFHLDALSAGESTQYIAHRLAVAGHKGALPFDSRALRRILQLTHGVPRRINLLCGRALLGAWANGLERVDAKVVQKAATEVFGPDLKNAPDQFKTMVYTLSVLTLFVVVGLLAFWWWSTTPQPQSRLQSVRAPQVASSVPVAAVPLPLPIEALEKLWPQLPTDINTAWRILAANAKPMVKMDASGVDPCQSISTQLLRCYRTEKLNLPLLRQLKRNAILTLQANRTPPRYAVLVELDEQTATLQLGAQRHRVRLLTLAQFWHGDLATFWQAPPGYQANLREGSSGPAIDHLVKQLSQLDGVAVQPGQPLTLDPALRQRLRSFQRAQGLKSDGLPGPMTFMQLDSAVQALRN